jgi:hypothetical protein
MRRGFRRSLQFIAFLAVTALIVASPSRLLDRLLVYVFWAVLIIGSAVAILKTWWSHGVTGQQRISYYGQASILPQRWRSWIFSESEPKSGK